MNLKEILCKCPKCGDQFAIGDALEQQAIEQVRAELALLNDGETQHRIEVEKAKAKEEAKKQAHQDILKQTQQKQEELDTVQAKLNALKIEKITSDAELKNLEQRQKTAVIMAAEEAKKQAQEDILKQTQQNQNQLDKVQIKLNELQIEKISTDAELKNLQQLQRAEITIKLAEEKSKWDAEKTNSETALKLQVQQLKGDIERASARAEQGSMQLQGEGAELAIEDTLKQLFPSDDVIEVKKGQRGGDCVLVVKNNIGRSIGKILFESKSTKSFSSDWITKLKSDTINEGAKIAVLVTTAWPSDNNKAHLRDGVWVCGFYEYQILVRALRQSLVEISKATASEEAREGKAQVMYDFLTSQEFAHTIDQMISPIFRMHEQLQKEKKSITRLWKERETLIEGSISGTESLYMKIQGIAQVNLPPVPGLDAIEDLSNE
jgi:hypothetical protein